MVPQSADSDRGRGGGTLRSLKEELQTVQRRLRRGEASASRSGQLRRRGEEPAQGAWEAARSLSPTIGRCPSPGVSASTSTVPLCRSLEASRQELRSVRRCRAASHGAVSRGAASLGSAAGHDELDYSPRSTLSLLTALLTTPPASPRDSRQQQTLLSSDSLHSASRLSRPQSVPATRTSLGSSTSEASISFGGSLAAQHRQQSQIPVRHVRAGRRAGVPRANVPARLLSPSYVLALERELVRLRSENVRLLRSLRYHGGTEQRRPRRQHAHHHRAGSWSGGGGGERGERGVRTPQLPGWPPGDWLRGNPRGAGAAAAR